MVHGSMILEICDNGTTAVFGTSISDTLRSKVGLYAQSPPVRFIPAVLPLISSVDLTAVFMAVYHNIYACVGRQQ